PGKLQEIRRKLAANRLTTPLFNTERYARHLEAAYEAMYARQEDGLPPDHILVQSLDQPPNGPTNEARERHNQHEQVQRATLLFQQNKLAESQGLWEQVLKARPDDFHAMHLLGLIALRGGQLDHGLDLLTKSIGINPNVAEAYSNRGNALLQLRRFNEALGCLEKAIELKPDLAEPYLNRGVIFQDLGRHDEAIANYDKAIELNPAFADAYAKRSFMRQKLGRHAEALADREKAFALDPDAPFALGTLLHMKFFVCDWQHWEKDTARLREMMDGGRKASLPFFVLAL